MADGGTADFTQRLSLDSGFRLAVVYLLDVDAGHEQVDDVRGLFDAARVSHATGELNDLLPVQLLEQTARVSRQGHAVERVVHETHDVPLTEHRAECYSFRYKVV